MKRFDDFHKYLQVFMNSSFRNFRCNIVSQNGKNKVAVACALCK